MKRSILQAVREALGLLWKDMKDAKWAVMLVIAYFVLGKYFLYSLCPMVVITGFPCPGCGLTRAGFRLLRLDFAGAFRVHPMIYPIAAWLLLFFWNRAQEGGRKSFRYEELNPEYILPKKHGILVPYLDILQKDLEDRSSAES